MYKLMHNEPLLNRLVDRQFQMIGLDVKIGDVKNGVQVKDGKKVKVVDWWKAYHFEDEEQYMEWKEWAANEIFKFYSNIEESELQIEINYLDLVWGMSYEIRKPIEELEEVPF